MKRLWKEKTKHYTAALEPSAPPLSSRPTPPPPASLHIHTWNVAIMTPQPKIPVELQSILSPGSLIAGRWQQSHCIFSKKLIYCSAGASPPRSPFPPTFSPILPTHNSFFQLFLTMFFRVEFSQQNRRLMEFNFFLFSLKKSSMKSWQLSKSTFIFCFIWIYTYINRPCCLASITIYSNNTGFFFMFFRWLFRWQICQLIIMMKSSSSIL